MSNRLVRFGVLLLIGVPAACEHSATVRPHDDAGPAVRLPIPTCTSHDGVEEKQRAIDAADRQAFLAAVAGKHVELVALPRVEEEIGQGLREDAIFGKPATPTVKRKDGTFVVGDAYWSQNGRTSADLEFVIDAQRRVFVVAPKRDGAVETIMKCGCSAFTCGAPCAACGNTLRVLYGPLPPGARFARTMEIGYRASTLAIQFADGQCPPEPCPP